MEEHAEHYIDMPQKMSSDKSNHHSALKIVCELLVIMLQSKFQSESNTYFVHVWYEVFQTSKWTVISGIHSFHIFALFYVALLMVLLLKYDHEGSFPS